MDTTTLLTTKHAATLSAHSGRSHTQRSISSSEPIKIPLGERFSSQLSTGSADSGCITSQKTSLLSLHIPSNSGSLSLHGVQSKNQLQRLKQQPPYKLLSQDSGIDGVGRLGATNESESDSSSRQQLKCNRSSTQSSSSESLGAATNSNSSSSGTSAAKLSSGEDVGNSGSSDMLDVRRCYRFPRTANAATQAVVEDRIEEVEIGDEDDENDDGVEDIEAIEDVPKAATQNNAANVATTTKILASIDETGSASSSELSNKVKSSNSTTTQPKNDSVVVNEPKKPTKDHTTHKSLQPQTKQHVLATDGNYYFPVLKFSDDPNIDSKLINKKDGLQDTMYYLDEFGSPKLREKYARKKHQKELKKQQKAKSKTKPAAEKKKRTTMTFAEGQELDDKSTAKVTLVSAKCEKKNCDKNNRVSSDSNCNSCKRKQVDDDDDDDDEVDVHVDVDVNNAVNDDKQQHQHQPDGVSSSLTVVSASTPTCVSWTKVVQKFRNILGKLLESLP